MLLRRRILMKILKRKRTNLILSKKRNLWTGRGLWRREIKSMKRGKRLGDRRRRMRKGGIGKTSLFMTRSAVTPNGS
jgi:hypothetical protein